MSWIVITAFYDVLRHLATFYNNFWWIFGCPFLSGKEKQLSGIVPGLSRWQKNYEFFGGHPLCRWKTHKQNPQKSRDNPVKKCLRVFFFFACFWCFFCSAPIFTVPFWISPIIQIRARNAESEKFSEQPPICMLPFWRGTSLPVSRLGGEWSGAEEPCHVLS